MPAKQTISLLATLSALIILPAGIATAGNVDVQNGDVRVRVTEGGGITVNSAPTNATVIRRSLPNSRLQLLRNRNQLLRVRQPVINQNLGCNGRSISQQSSQSNASGTATSRIYSSTTTTLCK